MHAAAEMAIETSLANSDPVYDVTYIRNGAAALPHRPAHGLRKTGAVIAAENGATASQFQSIFGWSTLKEAARYTKGAEQKRLARSAMHLLLPGCPTESAVVPHRKATD